LPYHSLFSSRGVKAEFANPLYKPASDSTEEPTTPPAHTLPLSDPEYSPDLRCPPRLLFKAARRLQGKKDIKLKQGDTVGDGETNTDAMPGKLTFARELALLEGKGE
jgi:hypothetical protein